MHGGTKAREASIARIGIDRSRQSSISQTTARIENHEAPFVIRRRHAVGLCTITAVSAAPKKEFNIAWTIYVGWMPWPYAADTGIVKKWADKYGITINVTQINDYVESINQYTAGKFDGVTVTNMDALTIPAAGGVDTTAIIMGDFSNGNDGVVLKKGKTLADIKGQKINLVELSVSHYLLARGLSTVNCRKRTSRPSTPRTPISSRPSKSPDTTAVVTWNPQLLEVKAEPGATEVFNSSKIPGEIEDLLVVNTETLEGQSRFRQGAGRHLVRDHRADEGPIRQGQGRARGDGETSGTDLAGFETQLKTTAPVLYAEGRRRLHDRRRPARRSWTWCAASASSTICSAKTSSRRTPSAS